SIRAGDVIAEIETDKATMEIEAVDEGTLARIIVPEGTENVAVNKPIAVIAGEGEDVAAAKAAKPSTPPHPGPLPSGERESSAASSPSPQRGEGRGEGDA